MSHKSSDKYHCEMRGCPGLPPGVTECHVKKCRAPKAMPPPIQFQRPTDEVRIQPPVNRTLVQEVHTPTVTSDILAEVNIMVPVERDWESILILGRKVDKHIFKQVGDTWLHQGRRVHRFTGQFLVALGEKEG